jgi:uncharacterized protein YbbK (DUF523 family)
MLAFIYLVTLGTRVSSVFTILSHAIEDRRITSSVRRADAKAALSLALGEGVAFTVLKSKSPSCGKGEIYDGSFTHTLILGNGVTAELLLSRGIPVYTEKEIQ